MIQLAPIILFVYNRPDHTKEVVNSLILNDLAKDSEIFIYADGPKDNASDDQIQNILSVRKFIKTIAGFKSVNVIEQQRNKGLDPSEIEAVSEMLSKYGKAIILEDDIVVHPFFLRFMNEALEVYKNVKQIFSIGSFSYNAPYLDSVTTDVYASYRSASWGWATWSDRWNKCIWDKEYLLQTKLVKSPSFYRIYKYNRGGGDMYDNLMDYVTGFTDAWDSRWQYCMYENNGICVYPTKSLSFNIGFDGTGVHCGVIEDLKEHSLVPNFYNSKKYCFDFNLAIKVSWKLQYEMRKFHYYDKTTFLVKIKRRIKSRIRKVFNI